MSKTLAQLNVLIGAKTKALDTGLGKAQKSINKFSRTAGKLGDSINRNVTLPFLGFAAVSLKNFDAQQKAIAKVESGLKSTGNQVGKTSEQFQKMASDLQQNSLFGDEDILENVTAPLLTFVKIQGDVFDQAQQNVVDYAAKLNIDLKSASLQVGKALNDPVKGINALARAGVQFTDEQKKLIKSLVDTGREADAQKIILKELEMQFGGTAKAISETGLGPVQQLKNDIGDLSESMGAILIPYVKTLAIKIKSLAQWFTGLDKQTQKNIVGFTAWVAGAGIALKVASGLAGMVSTMIGTFRVLTKSKWLAVVAQKALNLAMSANPIGLLVTAVAALGTAFFVAYKKSERFRGVVHGLASLAKEVFKIIKESIGSFMDGFNALGEGNFREAFKGFKDGLIKSNPIGIALTEGDRLGKAYKDGFKSALSDSEPIKIDPPKVDIPTFNTPSTDFSIPSMGGTESLGESSKTDVSVTGSESIDRASESVEKLSTNYQSLGVAMTETQKIITAVPELMKPIETMAESVDKKIQAMALSTGGNLGKMANSAVAAGKKFLRAEMMKGISSAISSALANIPFPFNIAAAAGAHVAANALFNKAFSMIKIPAFEKGGDYMGGLALVGEKGPELINFNSPGHITSNADLQNMMSGPSDKFDIRFGEVHIAHDKIVMSYEAGLNLMNRTRGNG